MQNRTSEKAVLSKIMKYLSSIEGSKFIKRPASIARSGEPDITGSLRGRHVEIEVKAPGNKPTELQLERLKEWHQAGAISFWADTLDQVKALIQ